MLADEPGPEKPYTAAMAPSRNVSVPITLTTFLVAMAVTLTVGWQILVAREFGALVEGFAAIHWILVIVGSLFFALIITAAILQTVWLVGEMRTNQRQQSFIDAVTHELHTPLASLRLYLDTLLDKSLDDTRRREFLGIMSEDLDQLHRTIDQILSAARTERRASRQSVDLVKLLRECVAEARERHALDADAVRLELPRRASVRGDLEQLRVAFRNLIENAIRYARERVQIDIVIRASSARRLEVEVADAGVGIPASALGRIFQRFQRLSHEAGFSTRGLGLGLYIVRNVVRAHGGTVRAESEGTGSGSRFIVTLPGQLDGHAHPSR